MIKKVFFNSNGNKLAAWLYAPEEKWQFPAVIRVHGYKGGKDGRTNTALAEKIKDKVFFRLDFHAHGESEGKEIDALQCVYDVKNAVDYLLKLEIVDKNKIALVGSSLGGLASILSAAWFDKVAVIVLVCPVSDITALKSSEIKFERLLQKTNNLYAEAEKIQIPVLIIHGDEDDVVPLNQSTKLANHLKNGMLSVVQGANHLFDQEKHFNEMLKQTVNFINKNL